MGQRIVGISSMSCIHTVVTWHWHESKTSLFVRLNLVPGCWAHVTNVTRATRHFVLHRSNVAWTWFRFSIVHTLFLLARLQRVPGPGSYEKTLQYPQQRTIVEMGRQHGIFFTNDYRLWCRHSRLLRRGLALQRSRAACNVDASLAMRRNKHRKVGNITLKKTTFKTTFKPCVILWYTCRIMLNVFVKWRIIQLRCLTADQSLWYKLPGIREEIYATVSKDRIPIV